MANVSSGEQHKMQQLDLTKLSLQQLTQLKTQFDQVLKTYNSLINNNNNPRFFIFIGTECVSRFFTNS